MIEKYGISEGGEVIITEQPVNWSSGLKGLNPFKRYGKKDPLSFPYVGIVTDLGIYNSAHVVNIDGYGFDLDVLTAYGIIRPVKYADIFCIGARVKRGPNWSYPSSQDNDGKSSGVIIKIFSAGQRCRVFWEHKYTDNYRIGEFGYYDLVLQTQNNLQFLFEN